MEAKPVRVQDTLTPGNLPEIMVDLISTTNNDVKQRFSGKFVPLELKGSSRMRYAALDPILAFHLDCTLGLGKTPPAVGAEIQSRAALMKELRWPMRQKFLEYGFSFDEYHQQVIGSMQWVLRDPTGRVEYFREHWLSTLLRPVYGRLCELFDVSTFCYSANVQRDINELIGFNYILGNSNPSFTVSQTYDQATDQPARMLLPGPNYEILLTYYSADEPFQLLTSKPRYTRQNMPKPTIMQNRIQLHCRRCSCCLLSLLAKFISRCRHKLGFYERILQSIETLGKTKDWSKSLQYRMSWTLLDDPKMRKYWYRMHQVPKSLKRIGLRSKGYIIHIDKCVRLYGVDHVFF
eukprot:CFRG3886T1